MKGPVLGIDPGGAYSGIVIRSGDTFVAHHLVRRDKLPVHFDNLRGYGG